VTVILADLAKDSLEYYRKMAMEILFTLISSSSELEDTILSMLLNKPGDLNKKVQQHSIYVLCRLLKVKPQLALTMVNETMVIL